MNRGNGLVGGGSIGSTRVALSLGEIFIWLIEVMEADSGYIFSFTVSQYNSALPHIRTLVHGGFFLDDPKDLDGSYWQCAAGDYDKAREFFSKSLSAYEALLDILNDIFKHTVCLDVESYPIGENSVPKPESLEDDIDSGIRALAVSTYYDETQPKFRRDLALKIIQRHYPKFTR